MVQQVDILNIKSELLLLLLRVDIVVVVAVIIIIIMAIINYQNYLYHYRYCN